MTLLPLLKGGGITWFMNGVNFTFGRLLNDKSFLNAGIRLYKSTNKDHQWDMGYMIFTIFVKNKFQDYFSFFKFFNLKLFR